MPRVFIALELPDAQKNELTQFCEINDSGFSFAWEAKSKLHLTLKFIGELTDGNIERLKSELGRLNNRAIKTNYETVKVIYKNDIASIIWTDLRICPELLSLVENCENLLFSSFGVPKAKRNFRPHITILRVKPYYDVKIIQKLGGIKLDSREFIMNKLVLYKSELFAKGSKYTELAEYDLEI